MATNYQIKLYQYDELSDAAKKSAFERWCNKDRDYYLEYEYNEAGRALESFCKYMPFAETRDHYSSIYFAPVDAFDVAKNIDVVPEYLETGDCYGYDLATAWNEDASDLKQIADALQDVTDYFSNVSGDNGAYDVLSHVQDELITALEDATNKALARVAKAYNGTIESLNDYYYDPAQVIELFEDAYARESVYTVDGRAFDPDAYGMTETV